MKTLLLILFVIAFASAQTPTPGTITATGYLATAGALSCTFNATAKPTIQVSCVGGGQTSTATVTPAVGSTSGYVGSVNSSPNSITWAIQQPTAGNVTWQIAANGTTQSGTF